jgi:hypothetical protein
MFPRTNLLHKVFGLWKASQDQKVLVGKSHLQEGRLAIRGHLGESDDTSKCEYRSWSIEVCMLAEVNTYQFSNSTAHGHRAISMSPSLIIPSFRSSHVDASDPPTRNFRNYRAMTSTSFHPFSPHVPGTNRLCPVPLKYCHARTSHRPINTSHPPFALETNHPSTSRHQIRYAINRLMASIEVPSHLVALCD